MSELKGTPETPCITREEFLKLSRETEQLPQGKRFRRISVPQVAQELSDLCDDIVSQKVDRRYVQDEIDRILFRTKGYRVHVPTDSGLNLFSERLPWSLPRAVDMQSEEQEKIQNPRKTIPRQPYDKLPELDTKKKKKDLQFVGCQILSPQLQKKEQKNKTQMEKNERLQETLLATAENKMMHLSLDGPQRSITGQEAIATPEVSKKVLEDLAPENMRLRMALEHLANKEPHEVDLGVAQAPYCRHTTSDLACAPQIQQQEGEAMALRKHGLEACVDGKGESLNQHIPTPPKVKATRSPRRRKVKWENPSEGGELSPGACFSQPGIGNAGTGAYKTVLEKENQALKDSLLKIIREYEEKEAQVQMEIEHLQKALTSLEDKFEREKQEKVKTILEREQELKKRFYGLRRIRRMYQKQQQVPVPPPKETAATPAGQYQGRKKEPLDKNQPESLVTCSQPERYLIVQSPNSSVFIVPSVPAILEPKGC